ncbi:hypothetical protein RUM44_008242 [Polyplax serrata]|uniref:Uncharacterized protein n=1 Tax=Polyplax serrata TaxID=468196 RepID=A0ABR1B7W7_POLSC
MNAFGRISVVFLFALFGAISARSLYEIESGDDSYGEPSTHGLVGYPGELGGYQKQNGGEHYSAHHANRGKKGDSGFSNHQHYAKGKKSHNNFREEEGQHSEKGGHKNEYHDGAGHHHQGHYLEKGEKGHSYGKKDGYKRGHSTKGIHEIHKLNEYKKNKEFFDEDYEEDKYEKHGGYERQQGSVGGGHYKLGHSNRGYEREAYGKTGHLHDLLHYLNHLGKRNREGQHEYYNHDEKFGKNGSLGRHAIFAHVL